MSRRTPSSARSARGRVERHVQEERPVLAAMADPLDHPFREARDDGVEIPAPGHRPRTRLPGAFGGPGRDAQGLGGLSDDPVVFEPGVRGEVGHVIAEIGIEPVRDSGPPEIALLQSKSPGRRPCCAPFRPRPAGRRASGCRPSSSRDATCRYRPSGSPGPAASRAWSTRRQARGSERVDDVVKLAPMECRSAVHSGWGCRSRTSRARW